MDNHDRYWPAAPEPEASANGQTTGQRTRVPAPIRRIIADLGLRFRPTRADALDDHRRTMELLAQDLADLPPTALEAAVRKWSAQSSFMPRAADLVKLAKGAGPVMFDGDGPHGETVEQRRLRLLAMHRDTANARLEADGKDIRWIIRNGNLKLDKIKHIEEDLRIEADFARRGPLTADEMGAIKIQVEAQLRREGWPVDRPTHAAQRE